MTDHHRADTETRLVNALRDHPADTLDLDQLSTTTVRRGTRVRRRRQGATVLASAALVGAASFGVAAVSPGDRASSVPLASPSVSAEGPVVEDGADLTDHGLRGLLGAVRVAPDDQYADDEGRFYTCDCPADARPTLNWRPAGMFSDYDLSDTPPTAEIMGEPAWVVRDDGVPTVVGPVHDGGFLTLSAAGLTETELIDLAASLGRPRGAGTS